MRAKVDASSLLCIIALPLLLAACKAEAPAPEPTGAPSTAISIEGLDLHAPLPDLLTSGQPSAAQWASLRDRGVTTVINLRPTDELPGRDVAAEVAAAGLRYHPLPIAGARDITFENAALVQSWLDAASGKVLLHCASSNRSGALVALMASRKGMEKERALELGRAAGMTSTEARVRELVP
ncbi:beta-lactamase hydrolase domain-containing protein [Chondromyces crocatus]|uniref:Beta-lactamase hydrolase-like protein phosphatase-like domain-containing protein n=1 Tax=Chondromyces crocatus TaxID=52 RepID=A0A0K1ERT7_CHOCO|nr:sulfur transferase domain-containing protein [Chondromyces crocatus]AKT43556.1 uncharacterized protein CMC5_077880 [Chondromyces crocatus]